MIDSIVLASKNKGKIKEIRDMLKGSNIKVMSMEEVGFDDEIEETGKTFYENAFIKAKTIYDKTQKVVLADDSGLCVDYLNDAPGIYSARIAPSDDERIDKLLSMLQDVRHEDRKARFVCNMVLYVNHNKQISVQGVVNGYIGTKKRGSNGFGYDPIFYLAEYDKTMAELSSDIKNEISHRARALNKIVNSIKELR